MSDAHAHTGHAIVHVLSDRSQVSALVPIHWLDSYRCPGAEWYAECDWWADYARGNKNALKCCFDFYHVVNMFAYWQLGSTGPGSMWSTSACEHERLRTFPVSAVLCQMKQQYEHQRGKKCKYESVSRLRVRFAVKRLNSMFRGLFLVLSTASNTHRPVARVSWWSVVIRWRRYGLCHVIAGG